MRACCQLLIIACSAIGLASFSACTGGNGVPGTTGANSLVHTSAEPAGANCAHGGTKIEVGVDTNDNGTLDASEVSATGTTYVCSGSSERSLILTSNEPNGANCPLGGTRLDSGLDANNNGTLDPAEVDPAATRYVCNFAPSGAISPSTGIVVAVVPSGVTTASDGPVAVRFTLKDDRGFPLDIGGSYSQNTPIQPRFALGYFTKNPTTGIVSPLTVYTKSTSVAVPAGQPTNYNPLGTAAGHGTLVENGLGAGDYTYTFPTTSTTNGPVAVAYDPTKRSETHVVWIQVSRQTDLVFPTNANTFAAANQSYYFIPDGTGTPLKRELVAQSGCDNCHAKFKPETTASAAFHGGGRVDAGMCNVCHNPGHTSNPEADSSSFIHRIHNGEMVATANQFHGIAATYPRDIRDCNTCHGNAAQGAQALTNPSTMACKGCHDYVSFTNAALPFCKVAGQLARDGNGVPVACRHVGGVEPDSNCATCHGTLPLPGGALPGFPVANFHKPVTPPDPTNSWLPTGTNANTNSSFVAAGGYVPSGAEVITYDVKSVSAVLDTVAQPNVKRPVIVFKFKSNGTDVVFPARGAATELMPHFVGSPSVYFAFAVRQDNNQPSDFNASASGYIKKIWDGTATGTGAGDWSGPDANGYYTIKLTGVQIPLTATMLTGGVGYTYALTSGTVAPLPVATPPLVQTNLDDYPWVPNSPADGKAQGGLSVPAPNVWKVATGYTGRRAIVDNAKCQTCHAALGVTPTFHAGQRNDGPTCSFCHNPNRTSAGWAAGSKYFIHAIHAGRKRTVNYTWHASVAGPGYDEVEFPGTLNTCTTCHLPNTYDFTNPTNLAAIATMPLSTVATGKYDGNALTNPATYYTVSPYVTADNIVDYGAGFSYNAGTGATNEAVGTTLVLSPITGACSACHDSTIAIDHMKANGGRFYAPRSTVLAPAAPQEQCMLCHGPGRVAAIGVVHQQ